MLDKGPEEVGSVLKAAAVLVGAAAEVVKLEAGQIGQGIRLQVGEEGLDGIQFRSVGGKQSGLKAGVGGDPPSDENGTMSQEPIPDKYDGAMEMAE